MCAYNITMISRYTIHWESKVTGASGHGRVGMDFIEAKREIKRLNKEYPQIQHTLNHH